MFIVPILLFYTKKKKNEKKEKNERDDIIAVSYIFYIFIFSSRPHGFPRSNPVIKTRNALHETGVVFRLFVSLTLRNWWYVHQGIETN